MPEEIIYDSSHMEYDPSDRDESDDLWEEEWADESTDSEDIMSDYRIRHIKD